MDNDVDMDAEILLLLVLPLDMSFISLHSACMALEYLCPA